MASDFPQIVVVSGPEEGLEYTLPSQGFIRIGRGDDNDLVLSDNSVSRHHLKIQLQDNLYFVSDANSSNGTVLEGRKLKAGQEMPLTHLDEIQIGIYTLRFLQKPFDEKEAQDRRKQGKIREKYAEKPEAAAAESPPEAVPPVSAEALEPVIEPLANHPKGVGAFLKNLSPRQKWIWGSAAGFLAVIIALGLWFAMNRTPRESKLVPWNEAEFEKSLNPDSKPQNPPEPEKTEAPPETKPAIEPADNPDPQTQAEKPESLIPEQPQQDPPATQVPPTVPPDTKPPQKAAAGPTVTFFLDVTTAPFSATLYLDDERIGRAPLKKAVTLQPGRTYRVHADFELPELHDIYRETQTFTVKGNEDVLTLKFTAALAKVNVVKLPRHADFYWSGVYEYDVARDSPVAWQRVSYGRPVFLPYGHYRLELRETASVSGSTNPVSRVTYQRDYILDADQPEVTISVLDDDLQKFPAKIKSVPPGAEIFTNGQKIGTTPFEDFLPVGENRLTFQKNGFFNEELTVNMTMNAPYETTVTLKTSKVGEKLLQAREFLRLDQDDQAIEALIEALKSGGSDAEKAEVYYVLGQTYLKKGQAEISESYFQRAETFEAWRDRAKLALAQVIFRKGDTRAALAKLSEVMITLTDESPSELRAEATNVFKKISPMHSAIYIYTEPAGARVLLNDKLLDQASPLLLSGLGLGNYRVQIEKDGFDTYNTKQNLKLSDFVIVKVKLKKSEL